MQVLSRDSSTLKASTVSPLVKSFILFLILGVVFFAFSPGLYNSLLNWDDDTHLYQNPLVSSLSYKNIVKIFTTPVNDTYIPLIIFSFAVEHHFFAFNPFVYHLDNLLLHLGMVALIFLFGSRLGMTFWATSIAALIFGVHPMHVESVTWVTERKDVLYSFFYLLSLIEYCSYIENKNKITHFVLSLLFGVLSILAKPMALSLPLILFLIDGYLKRPWNFYLILEKIPFFALIVPITWLTYSLNARVPGHSMHEAVLIWSWTFSFYLKKFVWPVYLMPYYTLPKPISLMNSEYLWAIFIMTAFIIGMGVSFRIHRGFFFAGLFYFLSVFFLMRFDEARDTNIVADRFMYLPSLGFCFFIGALFENVLNKVSQRGIRLRGMVYLLMIGVVGFFSVKTYQQSQIWKDNITFWNYVISKNPNISRAHNHRGAALVEAREFDLAIQDFSDAIRLFPNYPRAYCNRADTYSYEGRYDLALVDLNKSLQLDKKFARAYTSRGILYSKAGKLDEAISDFSQAIVLAPNSAKDYNNRGIAYKKKGEYQLAINDFSRSISLNPQGFESYLNRGKVYEILGQPAMAQEDLRRAEELNPKAAAELK